MFKFSQRSLDRMEGVDLRLVEIAEKAIQISRIDFGIPMSGGLRSSHEQLKLFKLGKSKADGTLNRSKHQTGLALDVYAYVNGKASWNDDHMAQIACAMLQSANLLGHELTWGGLWVQFKDTPHFQLE